MKSLIKKMLPSGVAKWYNNQKNNQEIFTRIYQRNHWGSEESISGVGSEMSQTETLIEAMNTLLPKLGIQSMLDLPCGDFNWMQRVNLQQVDYLGADIVEELIQKNKARFEGKNIRFKVLDLIRDPLPACDLIFVRDCLVHLSYQDIFQSLKNIKASGSKYLMSTTFTDRTENRDIETGRWRPINLEIAPFNLSNAILLVNENCTESDSAFNGAFIDKSMGIWEIEKIQLPSSVYR